MSGGTNTVSSFQGTDHLILSGGTNQVNGVQSIDVIDQSGGFNQVFGRQSVGTMNHTGGVNEVNGRIKIDCYVPGCTDSYNISIATLRAYKLELGKDGAAGFNINNALADISLSLSLYFGSWTTFSAVPGSKIKMEGASLDNLNTDPNDFLGFNNLHLAFNSGPGTSILEAAGTDVGPVWSGSGSFAFDTLTIGDTSSASVQLVNNRTNMGGTEAVYANNCVFGAGSVIDLNGINLYCNSITDYGVTVIHNGGQIIQSTTDPTVPEPVRIISGEVPVYYATLQEAYDNAVDGDSIQCHGVILSGHLIADENKSVTITGGYDDYYTTSSGFTTVDGNIEVYEGTLTIGNMDLVL